MKNNSKSEVQTLLPYYIPVKVMEILDSWFVRIYVEHVRL